MVADFNKKQNREFFNNQLLFKTLGIIFIITIAVISVADFRIYQKKKELVSQISAYQKKIADLEKSSQNLKKEIANSDNKDYLEKLAYEQLGEQKPGEQEIIFITPKEKPKAPETPQNFWSACLGRISHAWGWFKSKF